MRGQNRMRESNARRASVVTAQVESNARTESNVRRASVVTAQVESIGRK
jgi:hypothetical protein